MIVGLVESACTFSEIGWDALVGEASALPYRIFPAPVGGVGPGRTGNQALAGQLQVHRLALGVDLVGETLALVRLDCRQHLDGRDGVAHPVVQFGVDPEIFPGVAGVRPGIKTLFLRLHVEDQHGLGHGIRNGPLSPPGEGKQHGGGYDKTLFHIISNVCESRDSSRAEP